MNRLAAVAVTGLFLAGLLSAPAGAGEPTRDDVLKAAKKAAEFVVKRQNPDGGFGEKEGKPFSMVGYTGLVVAGLVETGTAPKDGEAVKKAVAFILSKRLEDGSICSKELGVQSYETAIAIMALAAVDKDKYKAEIKKAADYLMGIQDDGKTTPTSAGGIGYSKDGKNSNLSTTHYALQALKDAGVPEDSDVWKRAVAFVSACQNSPETNKAEWAGVVGDNSMIYSPKPESKAGEVEVRGKKGWRGYGSMTYAGYLCYVYARLGKDDPRVKGALKWICDNYTLDENPGIKQDGYYYYLLTFATAMHARGEATLKDKDGKEHHWAKELGAKLISLQAEDGSWLNKADRWQEGDKIICTAFGLRALGKVLDNLKPADDVGDALKRVL
jgi:squalene-hopene/tetraprenyl-beta-curcumene cyclase